MTAGQPEGSTTGPAADAELREDIERTRQELGETVEALAAKTDVKTRARKKVGQAKEQATARAAAARQKALSAARPAAEHVQGTAEVAGTEAWQALPGRVQNAAKQATVTARRANPGVLAAIAAAALLAAIAIMRRSRK